MSDRTTDCLRVNTVFSAAWCVFQCCSFIIAFIIFGVLVGGRILKTRGRTIVGCTNIRKFSLNSNEWFLGLIIFFSLNNFALLLKKRSDFEMSLVFCKIKKKLCTVWSELNQKANEAKVLLRFSEQQTGPVMILSFPCCCMSKKPAVFPC